ncbi:MAG TPA: PaaX domain-containing protein, C- domain protein [Acidimicrobiia bacterium]|jgi:phenylacetic acid degradation operon negative regulatory protein|nr:PaaX domain-containing protein, C- domain protein [Acidimicrobiia bacterium]
MAKDRNTADERPLGARSLIASLLLRTSPPRMSGARLVQWCELFDIAEGTARVALSRMVERGELSSEDGVYELAGRVGGRRTAQDWSLDPKRRPWDGTWSLALVSSATRAAADRTALRDAMRRIRMVELREGIWGRPDNLPRAAAPTDAWDVVDSQCTWWSARPEDELGPEPFGATEWSRAAERLRKRLTRATAALDRPTDVRIAEAFRVGVTALAHIRADPLLPAEMNSSHESADALRAAYRDFEAAFSQALQAWFRTHP